MHQKSSQRIKVMKLRQLRFKNITISEGIDNYVSIESLF